MSNDGKTWPKSRFSIRTLRVETELMEEDEGDPRGFDISLDDEAAGLILMNCLIHRDRNISFFVEQWPAIKSAVDLIAERAPTHDEVMGDRQLRQWALSLAASEPKASDGGLEMALGQAAASRRVSNDWDSRWPLTYRRTRHESPRFAMLAIAAGQKSGQAA